jgi:hypothetical protein
MEHNELLNVNYSINKGNIYKDPELEVNDRNLLECVNLLKSMNEQKRKQAQSKIATMCILKYKDFKRYMKNTTNEKILLHKKNLRVYYFCSKFLYYIYSFKFLFKKEVIYKELQNKLIEELRYDYSDSSLVKVLYNFVNNNLELAIFPLEVTGNYIEIEFFFNMCTVLFLCYNNSIGNLSYGRFLSSDATRIDISEFILNFSFLPNDKIVFPSILILSSNNSFFQRYANELINMYAYLFSINQIENLTDEEIIIKILQRKNESPQELFEVSVFLNSYLLNFCLISKQNERLIKILANCYQDWNWVIFFEFMKKISNHEKYSPIFNSINSCNGFLSPFFESLLKFYREDQIDQIAKIIYKFSSNFILFINNFLDIDKYLLEDREKMQKIKFIIFSLYITKHLNDPELVNKLFIKFNKEISDYKIKEIIKILDELQIKNLDESKTNVMLWDTIQNYFSNDKCSLSSLFNKSTQLSASVNQIQSNNTGIPKQLCESRGENQIPLKDKIKQLIQYSVNNKKTYEEIYQYIIQKVNQDKNSSSRSAVSVLKIDLKSKVKKILLSLNIKVLNSFSKLKPSLLSLSSFENKIEKILDYYFDNIDNENLSFSQLILKIQICLTWNVIEKFLNIQNEENNKDFINICNEMISCCWKSCYVEIEKIYKFNNSKDVSSSTQGYVLVSDVNENYVLQQSSVYKSSSHLYIQMQSNLSSFNKKKDSSVMSLSVMEPQFVQNNDEEITVTATENKIIIEEISLTDLNNFSENSENFSKTFDGQVNSFISSNPIEDSSNGQSFSLKISSLSQFISLAGYSNINVEQIEDYFKEQINFIKDELRKKDLSIVSNFELFEIVLNQLSENKMYIGYPDKFLGESWDNFFPNGDLYFILID